jgi:glycerophosphoryl diester phosphodiesterase
MVEFDVQLTKDKRFILMHDRSVDRTTMGEGKVSSFYLEGLGKVKTKSGYAIPTLEEAIKLAKEKNVRIFLDTKDNRDHEKQLVKILKRYKMLKSVIVDTERPSSSLKLKALCSGLKVAVSPPKISMFLISPIRYLRRFKADYVDINYSFVNRKLVEKLHSQDLGITVWVLNSKKSIKKFKDMGVDGVMSDYPGLFQG